MFGSKSFLIRRKKIDPFQDDDKVRMGSTARANKCVPCNAGGPVIHDASKVFKKFLTISKELDPETGRKTYKDVINTLTFLEKAAGVAVIDTNTILMSILERMEDLEGPILAMLVYRKSAFGFANLEKDLELEKKQRVVEEFLHEMTRVVVLIHSISEGKVCTPVLKAWNTSVGGGVPMGQRYDESSTQRFGNVLHNMISCLSSELEEDSTFMNANLGILRSSTVTHGMIRYPEDGVSPFGEKAGVGQMRMLKETFLSERLKVLGANAAKGRLINIVHSQSISESPIHRCWSGLNKQDGKVAAEMKESGSHTSTLPYEVAPKLLPASDKCRFHVSSESDSTTASDGAVVHANEPDTSGLCYFVHGPEQKSCVCSPVALSCSRHLAGGPLNDIIALLCNSRADAPSFQLVEDTYRSFIMCYPLVIAADELINRLVARCNVLFRGMFRNPCPLLKGSLLMLMDVVSSNFDAVTKETYEGLWVLFLRLNLAGKIGCARRLFGVIRGLTFNRETENYHYTCKGGLLVSKLIESSTAQSLASSRPHYSVSVDVMAVDPCVIAQQITLMLEELLHNITPQSFLVYSLEKSLPQDNAPSLLGRVFDKIANWIKTILTLRQKASDQNKHVLYFSRVGHEALNLNNLFLANAVAAALYSNQFYSLPCVRNNQILLRPLANLNDQSHNFQYYRKLLAASSPPRIPILFVHDSDLRKIHTRHSKKYKSRDSLNCSTDGSNTNLGSCGSLASCFSAEKVAKGASTCDSGTGTELPLSEVAAASETGSANLIDMAEMYEIRKYFHQYKLFEGGPHYRFEPNPDVLRIINNFSYSESNRRGTVVKMNEIGHGGAHSGT